jgi:peptidoglycan hydrolase-like protein with peptidoglycan-binding domain
MGEAWANWLHFEVHPDAALHSATVEQLVSDIPRTASRVVPTAALPQPTLRRGNRGANVELLQQVLAFWRYYTARCDGDFGPKTEAAVAAWQVELQRYNSGKADGIFGPRTHAAAAAFYAALGDVKVAA